MLDDCQQLVCLRLILLRQLDSHSDREHANALATKKFCRNIYESVADVYLDGRQIDADEYLVLDAPDGDTLSDSLKYTVSTLRNALCRIWPRSVDIK